MWVFQATAYCLYGLIGGEIFGPKKYRTIFGRHTMDTVSMLIMSYMGYESLSNFGGFSSFSSLVMPNGTVATIGPERAYAFSAAAQTVRLSGCLRS